MSILLSLYQKYHVLIKKLDEIYTRVAEKKAAANIFLEQENALFTEHRLLNLGLIPKQESITKAKGKREQLERSLGQLDPKSDEGISMAAELEKINQAIAQQQAAIDLATTRIAAIEKNSSWIKPDGFFSPQQRRDVSEKDLHAYMITINEAVKMKLQMLTLQGEIGVELTKAPKNEKEAAIKWSRENNGALLQQVGNKGLELLDDFQYRLNTAYQKIPLAQAQARYDSTKERLGAAKEHFLDSAYQQTALPEAQKRLNIAKERYENLRAQYLQWLTPEKRAKQDRYRSILPEYIVNELPVDTYLKGNRAWLIGSPQTEQKLKNIKAFLEKPFAQDKDKDIATLKGFLTNVGIHLSDKSLDRVYNGAIKEQLKAAEAEPPQFRR